MAATHTTRPRNFNNLVRGKADIETVSRLLPLLSPYARRVRAVAILAAVGPAATLLLNALLARAVAILTSPPEQHGQMLLLSGAILVVGAGGALVNHLQATKAAEIVSTVTVDLQSQLFDRRIHERLESITMTPAGRTANSILHDVPLMPAFLLNAISTTVAAAVTLAAVVVIIMYIDLRLLIAAALISIVAVPYRKLESRMRVAWIGKIQSMAGLHIFLEERLGVAGIKLSRNYDLRAQMRSAFRGAAGRVAGATFEIQQISSLSTALTTCATALFLTVVLVAANGTVIAGAKAPSGFVILVLCTPLLVRVLHDYSLLGYWISTAAAIVESLDLRSTVRTSGQPNGSAQIEWEPELAPALPIVRVQGLSFSYADAKNGPDRPEILRGVSFEVLPGEVVAVVGEVGGGKSTLALLLAGQLSPSNGSVIVNGRPLIGPSPATCLVDNLDMFFSGTIAGSLRMVDGSLSVRRMVDICEAVGVHQHVVTLPQGYETVIGERGLRLSSGQRQLLGIARAIVARPVVVVLDEATTSLNSEAESRAIRALRRELGCGVVLITHRFSTIAIADRAIVLCGGTVAASGDHEELLQTSDLYRQLHDSRSL